MRLGLDQVNWAVRGRGGTRGGGQGREGGVGGGREGGREGGRREKKINAIVTGLRPSLLSP